MNQALWHQLDYSLVVQSTWLFKVNLGLSFGAKRLGPGIPFSPLDSCKETMVLQSFFESRRADFIISAYNACRNKELTSEHGL